MSASPEAESFYASSPSVSILLPVRDAEATLANCLRSLQGQTLEDFEVVAVDDGSSDRTAAILSAWAETDPRLRPVRLERRGLVSALNEGLDRARAPYIARMDADDAAHPRRLELQRAHLEHNPETGLVACLVDFGGEGPASRGYARYVRWVNSLRSHREISLNRFVESPLAHPSVCFRRELVRRHGGYREGDFPEDYELWLRWLEAGVHMEKISFPLLVWNDRPGRLSRVDPRYSPEAFYRLKAGYLARWLGRFNPHHPKVWLVGSGRTSRKRAAFLEAHGVEIEAYVDVDPRKVGRTIHARPVHHRMEVPSPGECFLVSYVGSRGAREDIVSFFEGRGYRLGEDLIPAA